MIAGAVEVAGVTDVLQPVGLSAIRASATVAAAANINWNFWNFYIWILSFKFEFYLLTKMSGDGTRRPGCELQSRGNAGGW